MRPRSMVTLRVSTAKEKRARRRELRRPYYEGSGRPARNTVAVTAGSGSKSAMSAQPSRGAAPGLITKGLLAIQCETHSTSRRPVHRWPDIARIEILSWWSAIQLACPVCVYAFLTGQGREENYVSL